MWFEHLVVHCFKSALPMSLNLLFVYSNWKLKNEFAYRENQNVILIALLILNKAY